MLMKSMVNLKKKVIHFRYYFISSFLSFYTATLNPLDEKLLEEDPVGHTDQKR